MSVTSTAMRSVTVAVGDGYRVHVGSDLAGTAVELVRHPRVAVVSDSNVAPVHARGVASALAAAGTHVDTLTVPAGEASKSLAVWGDLLSRLARTGMGRDGAIVAVGGGVVGDLAGFAAASYLRGVALYQYPTSLLAMVDASVGGKTGLDLPEGKNLVGAFWQPRAVIADVATLRTLPEREFRQGTVELVKHGYLRDPELLGVVGDEWHRAAPPERLVDAVTRSVAVKAAVVAADERERGERAYLNLGHTLAHALEAASGLAMQHGDAVAYGMLYAGLLGRARGHADLVPDLLRLVEWLQPVPFPELGFDRFATFMARDKKAVGGATRFVLLRRVGEPYLAADVSDDEQRSAFRELEELVR